MYYSLTSRVQTSLTDRKNFFKSNLNLFLNQISLFQKKVRRQSPVLQSLYDTLRTSNQKVGTQILPILHFKSWSLLSRVKQKRGKEDRAPSHFLNSREKWPPGWKPEELLEWMGGGGGGERGGGRSLVMPLLFIHMESQYFSSPIDVENCRLSSCTTVQLVECRPR